MDMLKGMLNFTLIIISAWTSQCNYSGMLSILYSNHTLDHALFISYSHDDFVINDTEYIKQIRQQIQLSNRCQCYAIVVVTDETMFH